MPNSFSIYTNQLFSAAPTSALYQNPILINLSSFNSSTGYFTPSFTVTTTTSLGINAIANFRYIFSNNGTYNPATSASIFAGASSIPLSLPSGTNLTLVINPGTLISIGALYMYVWLDLFNVNSAFTLSASGYTASVSPSPAIDNSAIITVNPTVTAATYTSGQVLGGLFTLSNALNTSKNTGYLDAITLNFNATILLPTEGFYVYLFNANPTASTLNDNATAVINSADVGKIIGWVNVNSFNCFLGAQTTFILNKIGMNVSSTNGIVYAVVVCQNSITMTSSSTFVNAVFSFTQD